MWSIIPLKNFHMFKIVSLEIFFKQKLITNSTTLNKWKFFSGMVDKWRGSPKDSIISPESERENKEGRRERDGERVNVSQRRERSGNKKD